VLNTARQQHIDPQQQQHQYPAAAADALSLVSYDVEARMKMFGWLNRYNIFTVSVLDIDEVEH